MIIKNALGDSPSVVVSIVGGTVPDRDIASVEVTYSENKHDIATIVYSGFPPKAVTAYRGLPVFISFGTNEANTMYFHGYVAYVEANAYTRMGVVNNSLIQEAKVVCFGTSYEMKPTRNTVYKNITLPKLVSTVAKRYGFSYSVPDNGYVFKTIEQSTKSDWEVLVETANKLGYHVSAANAHLCVYDPLSSFFRRMSPTILRTINSDEGKERKPGNILEFSGTFGDITPYGDSYEYLLKTLDTTGRSIEYSTAESVGSGLGRKLNNRFVQEITFNATSREALRQFARGYERQSIPLHADVTVLGSSTLFPGSLVQIDNYDSEFDGLWVVAEARHLINTDHYMTYLHIKTDSTNQDPARDVGGKSYVRPPMPKLSGNIWVSEKEFGYVY